MKHLAGLGLAIILSLSLVACRPHSIRDDSGGIALASTLPAALADDSFKSTLWQQTAAEYDALSLQVYTRAEQSLQQALQNSGWDALDASERQIMPRTDRLAIITDIDETLLDNSAFSVRQMRESAHRDMTPAEARIDFDQRWLEWALDAEATAMPGAVEFMQSAAANPRVEIFYITNRKDNEKLATCQNLLAVGLPLVNCESHVLTRNDEQGRGRDKVSRRQMVAKERRIALVFGDNLGDFIGNIMTSLPERDAVVAAKKNWWGERWFMLPNPSYGSWEDTLNRIEGRADDFDTAAERHLWLRQKKEKLLEDCRQRQCLQPQSQP